MAYISEECKFSFPISGLLVKIGVIPGRSYKKLLLQTTDVLDSDILVQ